MKNLSSEPGGARRIEAFVYRDSGAAAGEGYADDATEAVPQAITEEEAQAREAAARRQGAQEARRETEARLESEHARALEAERAAIAAALGGFARERQDYFRQLEREVVQLALAVARKVLHREAQIDPLLLAGTVRVALDQLAGGARIELHVPPSKLRLWQELLQRDLEVKCQPVLRADAALEPAGCRLETETGVTDLSLDAQLREVEQGFLDLLDRRQRATSDAAAARREPAPAASAAAAAAS